MEFYYLNMETLEIITKEEKENLELNNPNELEKIYPYRSLSELNKDRIFRISFELKKLKVRKTKLKHLLAISKLNLKFKHSREEE
mgnify:CR=1 FL=1